MAASYLTTGMRARCMVDRITTARPVVALSTYRKLRRDHSGGAYSLRRSSDSVHQITPHRGRLAHTGAAQSFIGAVDGLCGTWFDQGGAGNDLFGNPAGVQPALILAGALQTYTTVPVFRFDGSNDQVGRTDRLGLAGNVAPLTLAMVCKINTVTAYFCMFMMGTTPTQHFTFNGNNANQLAVGGASYQLFTGISMTSVHRYVATHPTTGNTDFTLSIDGAAQSGSPGGTAFSIGGSNGTVIGAESGLGFPAAMSCSFFAMWNAALTADEHSILQEEMLLHAA